MAPLLRSSRQGFMHHASHELQAGRLLAALSAGFVSGLLIVVVMISFAAMIFSGDLSRYAPRGIGMILLGAFLTCTIMALLSSYPGTIALPQDAPTAILAVGAAAICSGLPVSASGEAALATLIALMAVASLLAGAFFLSLGYFRVGDLIRYIPYPVVGGFLAGIGWLLLTGSFGVMTGRSLSLSSAPQFLAADLLVRWLPGAAFGVLLCLASRRLSHFLLLPLLLAAATGLFYLGLAILGTSVSRAGNLGLLLGPFPEGGLWQPPTPALLAHADWSLILGQAGNIGTILLVSAASLLLNASALELTVGRDIDLNQELRASGITNLLVGLAGGSPTGYVALSLSALNHKLGADSRLAGLATGGVCGLSLLFGGSLLPLMPRPVLGGLVFFLGLSFLLEWTYDAWRRLPRTDSCLILLILAISGALGFLQGVAAGILAAVMLFVVNYSRINAVKHALSGAARPSNVERAAPYRRLLQEKGEQIHILTLQGFIFFGSAHELLEQIRRRIRDERLPRILFLVLDFRLVSGLDTSALNCFARLRQLEGATGFRLVFTHLSPGLRRLLERGVYADGAGDAFRAFDTLDRGVEWCEDEILAAERRSLDPARPTLAHKYGDAFFDAVVDDLLLHLERQETFESILAALHDHLEAQDVEAGVHLVRQGEPPRALYFIESGQVTLQLEGPEGRVLRLRTMGAGTMVGEAGLYQTEAAPASAVTGGKCRVWRLSLESLKAVEASDPALASAFHRFIAGSLSERLQGANKALQTLLEQ